MLRARIYYELGLHEETDQRLQDALDKAKIAFSSDGIESWTRKYVIVPLQPHLPLASLLEAPAAEVLSQPLLKSSCLGKRFTPEEISAMVLDQDEANC